MPRQSSIQFQTDNISIVLRSDYLTICKDNHCAAMVLAQMQYWYDVKIAARSQAQLHNAAAVREGMEPTQDEELWVYKKQTEMRDELMGLFGETAISKAYTFLLDAGFLSDRCNPLHKWDKTRQYLFMVDNVQQAIDAIPNTAETLNRSRKITASKSQKYVYVDAKTRIQSRNITAALPETTNRDYQTETTNRDSPNTNTKERAFALNMCLAESFAAFWQEWEDKRDKEKAWRIWQKIAPDAELAEKIVQALIAQKRNRQEIAAIPGAWLANWKLATTWLNGKCWEDALIPLPQFANNVSQKPKSKQYDEEDETWEGASARNKRWMMGEP